MRHRTRSRYLAIGTISEGTLRPEDLIPAYLDALRPVRLSRTHRREFRLIDAAYRKFAGRDDDRDAEQYWESDAPEDLDDLYTMADDYCPPYCHVGSTDGDGALIGVWPSVESAREDTDEVVQGIQPRWPEDGRRYWLSINDHGNATLYARIGRTWARYRAIWSVV